MSPFKEKVIQIIQMVPFGKVASYGQIAAYAGAPRAAREVGWILNSVEETISLPWWRVVNNKGYLSIRGNQTADKGLQAKLLQSEAIEVDEHFMLDIEKYRWHLDTKVVQKLQLDEAYVRQVLEKYQNPEEVKGINLFERIKG